MGGKSEIVLAFGSTSHAIAAERLLENKGIRIAIMPLPPAIKSGCGICIRVMPRDISLAEKELSDKGLIYTAYIREIKGVNSSFRKLSKEETR